LHDDCFENCGKGKFFEKKKVFLVVFLNSDTTKISATLPQTGGTKL
jgi:hypothetical protein